MLSRAKEFINRKFRDLPLIKKIMFIYIVISVIPILILGIVMVHQEMTSIRNRARESVQQSLTKAAGQMTTDVRIFDNISDYIAYNQPVSNVLSGNFSGSRYELYEQYNRIVDPILTSPTYFSSGINRLTVYVDRDIAAHSTSVAPLSEIADEKWYIENLGDFQDASKWLIDAKEKTVRNVRLMPLMEQSGSRGLLYLEIDYNSFFNEFKGICQKGQGLYIYDSTGKVAYSAGDSRSLSASEVRKHSNSYRGFYLIKRKVSGTGLSAAIYGDSGFSPGQYLNVILFLIIYLVIVIATLFMASKMFGHYVVRDIVSLEENMDEVGKGNRTLTVHSDSQDEIGSLIRGFGKMLDEENSLIKENYENKLALRKAEMKALQAQINPHFLYNSLSLINWKAIELGADDISDITLSLSNFYRTSLNRGKNVLTVEKEIENVKSYIAIQSYMHDNSFDTVIDVDEDILPYETLNLILQPLVENAIDHGIDMKEDGRGYIKIIGRQSGDDITLTVEDDGVGMDAETAAKITTFRSHGYGVANVNERIRLFYGQPYGLKVTSEIGKGTRCTVTIPKRLKES